MELGFGDTSLLVSTGMKLFPFHFIDTLSTRSCGKFDHVLFYVQLDDASCRHTGGIGGCLLALSIWSWERLPVGRPKTVKYEDWDDKDDPLRLPTWAYKWDVLNETTDDPSVMYKLYKSELDAITPEQVNRPCISDYHACIFTRYQFCIQSHFAGGMGAVWKRREFW